jgi:hypothetical protein
MRDQSVARPLPKHRATQSKETQTKASMHPARFKPTFEKVKTVHASLQQAR